MSENQVVGVEEREMAFKANGEEVRLTQGMVKKYLVRGNAQVTDQEIMLFMNLCKFNGLNPFLNEAYLVKFGSNAAQMITSKDAFMKRAECHPNYEGFKAGIIVLRNNEIVYQEGCFKLKSDELVGGWAEVYRSDRKNVIRQEIAFDEYNKGQSLWKDKPTTMIRKTALVQALREAFPDKTSGLYTEDEQQVDNKTISRETNKVMTASKEFEEVIDATTVEVVEENKSTEEQIAGQVESEECPL